MDFSIIVPTHQRKAKLTALLKSLEAQSFDKKNFEVIVVATDKDPAFEVVQNNKWDLSIQITTVPKDPTNGRSASIKRNYGVQLAKAPWIGFIDDDCIAHGDWIKNAAGLAQSGCKGIEGHTHIPEPEKPTLTYKGMQRLSRPGGYQTCNMFYNKEAFNSVGGFDPNFPFYLEDTDLAWSIIEKGGKIAYCSEVKVEHPSIGSQPKRLLDNAKRMRLHPYLLKKHPNSYKSSGMRPYPRAYFIFLFFDLAILLSVLDLNIQALLGLLGLKVFLTGLYTYRLFRGLSYSRKEWLDTFAFTLICPIVGFFQLMRGNFEQGTLLPLKF